MKFVIRLKGGSGSGNFGHEGRPGEVGGSAIISTPPLLDDVTQVHTDEVIITRYGKQYTMGYFILPDGHIIDTSTPLKEGDDEESSHIEVVNEHPEWFGIDKASAEDMDSTEVLNKVVHAGSVRVRWYASDKLNKSRLVLETGTVDKAMLRKLQRLYDQRKFPYGHVVDWSAGNAHGEFPLPDFLNAKYVNVEPGTYGTNSIILKEAIIVIKGGSGSGNFGHGGRPGEVGGSASERGGGGGDYDPNKGMGVMSIRNSVDRLTGQVTGTRVYVWGNYSSGFVSEAHNLGGRWDSGGKCWIFAVEKKDAVKKVFDKFYNEKTPETETAKYNQDKEIRSKADHEYRERATKEPASSKQVSYIAVLLTRYDKASGGSPNIKDFGEISKLRASEIIDSLKSEEMAASMGLFPRGGDISERY